MQRGGEKKVSWLPNGLFKIAWSFVEWGFQKAESSRSGVLIITRNVGVFAQSPLEEIILL